jgi:hypothetical protein
MLGPKFLSKTRKEATVKREHHNFPPGAEAREQLSDELTAEVEADKGYCNAVLENFREAGVRTYISKYIGAQSRAAQQGV